MSFSGKTSSLWSTFTAAFFAPLLLVLAASYLNPTESRPLSGFNSAPLDRLNSARIDTLFLGNSMLGTRIDEETFARISGRAAMVLPVGGVTSAGWYLQMKNIVAAADMPPRRIFVFFRDGLLTDKTFRTQGKYREILEEFMRGAEPAYWRVLESASMLPVGRQRMQALAGASFLQTLRSFPLDTAAAVTAVAGADVNALFSSRALRAARDSDMTARGVDVFSEVVEDSFLPLMLNLKPAGSKLCFVRLKRRAQAEGRPVSPPLKQYLDNLRRYLAAHDASLVDMNHAPGLSAAWYGDGDHIAAAYKSRYTRLFHGHAKTFCP